MNKHFSRILAWTSRTFGVNARYLLHGSFWQGTGQLSNTFFGLITATAFANLLPKETYGVYAYILSIVGILTTFTLTGMDTAIIQSVARGHEGTVVPSIKTRMRWGGIGAVIAVIIGTYYLTQHNTTLGYAFFVAAAFIPFTDSLAIFYDILKGKKLFAADTKFSVVVQAFVSGISVATLFLTQNIVIIILAYFASYTLCHLILFVYTLSRFPLNQEEDPDMISYGIKLTFVRLITNAATSLDKIILFQYMGAAELAVYTFATAPIKKVEGLMGTIPNLAMPRFSEYSKEEIKKPLPKKVLKFSIFILVVIAAYIFFIPYFYRIFFPQYSESIYYSQLLSLTLLTFPLSLVYTYFQSQALTKIILPYKIIIHSAQILLLFGCIYYYGLMGAVMARIIISFITAPLALLFFRKS